MNPSSKNKLLTWLVILLLIANAATIAMFWLGKPKRPPAPQGSAIDFLIKELNLDAKQQEQYKKLADEHRQAAEKIRQQVKEAKDSLFDLIKDPAVSDSVKQARAAIAGKKIEQIDLLTLNHFQQVRQLCNTEQQKKFDMIIQQVTAMMGQPRPPMGPGGPQGPPPSYGPPH